MKVFKFGGASVKDANGVRNVASVLQRFPNEKIVVVISAMGKTTNALEKVARSFYDRSADLEHNIQEVRTYHELILHDLFPDKVDNVYQEVNNLFAELMWILEDAVVYEYNQVYDQIVSFGELLSTKIVSEFLKSLKIKNTYLDIRDCIKTDATYREGKVNWAITEKLIHDQCKGESIIVTQGFIGATDDNFTTTLGREGSDYTAAILAYALNAESVTIWKDVAGVLNADPKYFPDATLIPHLSYFDAIELAYYGATVIHPKTIKPLQNKNIPLFVKSFLQPDAAGTIINTTELIEPVSSFIYKNNQALISIFPKDFSFIVEENLSRIFLLFSAENCKINLMQNSALSFSVCMDNSENNLLPLIEKLKKEYKVLYNEKLQLITVRHYNDQTIAKALAGKIVLLEQRSRNTVQFVVKENA